MKKLLSIVLALTMVLSLASVFPVSAVGIDTSTEPVIYGELVAEPINSIWSDIELESVNPVIQGEFTDEPMDSSEVIASGYCGGEGDGTNLTWVLTGDHTLTISGSGAMYDYGYISGEWYYWWETPWNVYAPDFKIMKVVIEYGVTSIGALAFQECDKLESIEIPISVTSIGEGAFFSCKSLESIKLPNSLVNIGKLSFSFCGLASVEIPSSVTSIKENIFWGCTKLSSIHVNSDNPAYSDINNVLFTKDKTKLICYPAGKNDTSYTIPNSVVCIGEEAFGYCYNLVELRIPDSVTSIENAFRSCLGLESILVSKANPSYCSVGGVLFDKNMTTLISHPAGIQSVSYAIPNTVTCIYKRAFSGCRKLISINIPDSVNSIGESAFDVCYYLTSIEIPSSVSSIGDAAFGDCYSLTSILIPDSVTRLGKGVFYNSANLANIYCEAESQPADWHEEWKKECDATVHWGFKKHVHEYTDDWKYGYYTHWHECMCGKRSEAANHTFEWKTVKAATEAEDGLEKGTCSVCKFETERVAHSFGDNWQSDENNHWQVCSCGEKGNMAAHTWDEGKPSTKEGFKTFTCTVCKFIAVLATEDVDNPKHLSELRDEDFLAFSQLAYENAGTGTTVRDMVIKSSKSTTLEAMCSNIMEWTVYDFMDDSNSTGFAAYVFVNKYNERVLAFRGSTELKSWPTWDWFNDWIKTNLVMYAGGGKATQVAKAVSFYKKYGESHETVITGHSLGGALCDIVSACFDIKGVSFNAAPFLTVAYYNYPTEMGRYFTGAEDWKFTDHVTIGDENVGDNMLWMKNYIRHEKADTWLGEEIDAHSLKSMIYLNPDNSISFTPVVDSGRTKSIAAYVGTFAYHFSKDRYIYLGSNGGEIVNSNTESDIARNMVGSLHVAAFMGDGNDRLVSPGLGSHTFIGGRGDDTLDAGPGDDTYIYYKGDGLDTINDVLGKDTLKLVGFSGNDFISVVSPSSDPDYCEVLCNGSPIVRISMHRSGAFTIDKYPDEFSTIPTDHKVVEFKGVFSKRIIVACPVDVEIIEEATGKVVHVIHDGELDDSAVYTEYGYFYVYQDEDGEFVKMADLFEGYSVHIVGNDTGSMSITFYEAEDDILGDSYEVSDVNVTAGMSANIVDDSDTGIPELVIDYDGDGVIDTSIEFKGSVEKGDVDNDGKVTSRDRVTFARYLAAWPGYEDINEAAADVDNDGKVTSRDRVTLARHLAGWPGYEKLPYDGK